VITESSTFKNSVFNFKFKRIQKSPENSNGFSPAAASKREQQLPSIELLCPFEDKERGERHLMTRAVLVPCCGYFICCEECLDDRLAKQHAYVECPHDTCLQEITSNHRYIPHKPMRQRVDEYILNQSRLLQLNDSTPQQVRRTFSVSLFTQLNSTKTSISSSQPVPSKTAEAASLTNSPTPDSIAKQGKYKFRKISESFFLLRGSIKTKIGRKFK
jgi:hypothetical protein